MISVLLLTGDMSVGADGTVTWVDGRRVLAFGHRFLSVGATELPFARSEVLALAPNLATSFKISAARELMGAITGDYSTAVRGELGRRAAMVPLSLRVTGPARGAGENGSDIGSTLDVRAFARGDVDGDGVVDIRRAE